MNRGLFSSGSPRIPPTHMCVPKKLKRTLVHAAVFAEKVRRPYKTPGDLPDYVYIKNSHADIKQKDDSNCNQEVRTHSFCLNGNGGFSDPSTVRKVLTTSRLPPHSTFAFVKVVARLTSCISVSFEINKIESGRSVTRIGFGRYP